MKRRCRHLTKAERKLVYAPPESNAGAGWFVGGGGGRYAEPDLDNNDVRARIADGAPRPEKDLLAEIERTFR